MSKLGRDVDAAMSCRGRILLQGFLANLKEAQHAVSKVVVMYTIKLVFRFNRTVAKRSHIIVSISLVVPECSRNNEIRYVSLRLRYD